MRNCVRCFLDIVHSEKVGIVDSCQMNPLPIAFYDCENVGALGGPDPCYD